MEYLPEGGPFFELNVVDWLILLAGVALTAVVTLLFLVH